MPKRTTAQKRARELQRETGKPYMQCLNEALAAQAAREAERQPEPELPTPIQATGLFSHA
jgi:hypothetical protein